MGIKLILFDLGGVLVELKGLPISESWIVDGRDPHGIWRGWLQDPVVHAFERGQITPEAFAQSFIKSHDLAVEPSDFLTHFLHWPQIIPRAYLELLARARQHFDLGILSNISILHWQRLMEKTGHQAYFDHHFFSFQMGLSKPSAQIFEALLSALPVEPAEILFLDDSAANIEAAQKWGIQGLHIQGADMLLAYLQAFAQGNGAIHL